MCVPGESPYKRASPLGPAGSGEVAETSPRASNRQHMTQPWEGGIHHPGQRQGERTRERQRGSEGAKEGGGRALSPLTAPLLSWALEP